MARKKTSVASSPADGLGARIQRPLSLIAQVEQILRDAIVARKFPGNRLPTEVELADQLGVSRETVRRAAETLQREGLLVKYRRKGTFTQPPRMLLDRAAEPRMLLGYLQAHYPVGAGSEEGATRAMSGLMLQGALDEAGQGDYQLVVRNTVPAQMSDAFRQLQEGTRLDGVIFASYGEEKLLRRVMGQKLAIVLLDHDLHLPQVSSVRDDSQEGARQAVRYLAGLGHRRIGFAGWQRTDLNPWRLAGYRRGLQDAGLPRRRTWEILGELDQAGARALVEKWRHLHPRPTALLCFNNTFARHISDELYAQGLEVPRDLSIMGCGGEDAPGLTCHQADWYAMGRAAVQVLLRAIKGGADFTPEHLLSPHVLRVGTTTGPMA